MRLKISVSGVRGVVGETLTPRLLARFSQAFGTYVGPGKVLVGRDTRPSGQMVMDAVFAGLLSTGCTPIDLGIAPVPSIQLRCAARKDIRGGIAITASHNPAEWNALKLLSDEGLFLSVMQANELLDIYNQGTFRRAPGEAIPSPDFDETAIEHHLDAVLAQVDVPAIRKASLRVAVDCVNGAGAEATPHLLTRLGCQIDRLGCQPSGHFHRPPEPVSRNLAALCRRVIQSGAQVGFAQDADADRLAVVDAKGRVLEGDVMLALLMDLVLSRTRGSSERPPAVVVNLSTSWLVDAVAARHGAEVIRTPVGEANVVEAMLQRRAVIGGEGSGGLIYPEIHLCRDSFIAMALMLEFLARSEQTVAELVDKLPPYVMIKDKIPMPSTHSRRLLTHLRGVFEDAEDLDLRDGVRARWEDRWVHVRGSNTEPVLRLIVEAHDRMAAEELHARIMDKVQEVTRG